MNNASRFAGLGTFIANLIFVMILFGGILALYYLVMPVITLILASLLTIIGALAVMDHVPIGTHGLYIYRDTLQGGDADLPDGVPRWLARFASEGDAILTAVSMLGVIAPTVALPVYALVANPRFLAMQPWELDRAQLLFLPHLLGFVTLGLVSLRDQLFRQIYRRASLAAQRAS